ncbi:MAG TPA: hypothetical protein VNZ45_15125 [Bacteroidia bacterium]|jgi:hypothetical protein|nr:hypothetical protein [Bacteroidia bacterium]
MKNTLLTIFLSLLLIQGFSQNHNYTYRGRYTPSIKKEKLNDASFICEIMPDFWHHFNLPNTERDWMNELFKIVDSPDGHYIYSQENWFCPQEGYSKIMDYVAIEITATCNGKTISAENTGEALTNEQKNILNTADLGTDISIKIKFKYKEWAIDSHHDIANKIKEGDYKVTVVPGTEAEYPGGFQQMSKYFTENVLNKLSGANEREKFTDASLDFSINEEGQIVETKISSTSNDLKIDKLILDAANKMPKWTPAKNAKGVKVKQVFSIQFGAGC